MPRLPGCPKAHSDQLLEDLSELPATDIYVVAHSMGSRIVSAKQRGLPETGTLPDLYWKLQ